MKYDSFVIDSDDDLQVLFHCCRQFPEVRTHELLVKLGDVVSSLGGSNRNHQSSSTPVIASLSLFVMASARDFVASLSFATDLHRDEISLGAEVKISTLRIKVRSKTTAKKEGEKRNQKWVKA
ncbi:hypothetical protein Ahy_B05g078701 isoform B [Arachis hypogaea]|uniref:Uncharacterized protein n=1 Tax=Arachis hypogaea TaxID=3818 RepID=A0A444Z7S3_ARAHY|nr:hypothetical protein Ahy_B05g078701 isoform B [Arachis hypogaea]